MTEQLAVYMVGDLGAKGLYPFCERLGLSEQGRLDDDWDEDFGHRYLRPRDGRDWCWMGLFREGGDRVWVVNVTYQHEPLPAAELETLRQQILEAAASVGMEIRESYPWAETDRGRAALERLAAWLTARSPVTGRTFIADDLAGFTVMGYDEDWLVFTPPGRANRVYLVSDDSVYSFAPSHETFEAAVGNARAQPSG